MRQALALLAGLSLGAGCHRAARPDFDDVTAEAGVPVRFGGEGPDAPALTWTFGDKSPAARSVDGTHAYARAGRYKVRAVDDAGREAGELTVTVEPRAPLGAIPASAEAAFFLVRQRVALEQAVDFLENLLGAPGAEQAMERVLVPALAIELSSEGRGLLDPDEGLGLFALPGYSGTIGFFGVLDEGRALLAVAEALSQRGAQGRTEKDGSQRYLFDDERRACVFADRGYLYLTVDGGGQGGCEWVRGVVQSEPSLSHDRRVRPATLADGQARFLLLEPKPDGLAVIASLRLEGRALTLDGVVLGDQPLPEKGPRSSLMVSAPAGPVAAVSSGVESARLLRLFGGAEGSPRRKMQADRWRRSGLPLEALAQLFNGELGALAYFDPGAFFTNLLLGSERPEPRGALLIEAGTTQKSLVEELLVDRLAREGFELKRTEQGALTRYRSMGALPIDLRLGPARTQLLAGTLTEARQENLSKALGDRFGGGAFSPGHVSAMVDLARLRDQLSRPMVLPGVDPERFVKIQAFALTFFDKLTSIEVAFLDLGPDDQGGRLRGTLTLRAR